MCAERKQVAFNDSPEDILNSSNVLDRGANRGQRSLYDRLMDCLKEDDVEKVKEIIRSDLKSCENFTLLHFAAKAGASKVLQFCLDTTSPNINCRDSTGEQNTALYWAIKEGHRDCVHLLLEKGASSDALNIFDDDAVYVAVSYGHFEILLDLLARGLYADGPARSIEDTFSPDIKKGITSLCRAIMQNDNRMVSALIEAGADIHKYSLVLTGTRPRNFISYAHRGLTIPAILKCMSMHIAVHYHSSTQIVSTLLEAGFDLNRDYAEDENENPIILAATQGHYDQVKVMLKHCQRSDVHSFLLRHALNLKQLPLVKEVIDYQVVDLKAEGSGTRRSFLYIAAHACFIEGMKYLISKSADPSLVLCPYHIGEWLPYDSVLNDYSERRKRQRMTTHGQYSQVLTVLLEATGGKDLNKVSPESGTTLFYVTCSSGYICLSLQLMRSGADVHKANFAAISPLHHLVRDAVKPFRANSDNNYRLIIMLLLFIVDFQQELPWLADLLLDVETFSKLLQPIQNLIKIRLSNPSSLLELTRAAIYKYLGNNAHLKLNQLLVHLPISLKSFLDLDDLIQAPLDLMGSGGNNYSNCMACLCNPLNCLRVRDSS